MKSKLLYIFFSVASLILFQGCLMDDPDDIYKMEVAGGGGNRVDFSANTTSIVV